MTSDETGAVRFLGCPRFGAATLLLMACSARQPTARPRAAAPVAAPIVDVAPLADFEPERYRAFDVVTSPLPPPVEPARDAACRFGSADWSGELHVAADLPAFVRVWNAYHVSVVIPAGDAAQGAGFEGEVLGVQLRARVPAAELELWSKRPRLFGGYYGVLPGRAVMIWESARRGLLALRPRVDPRVTPAQAMTPVKVRCEELSLEPTGDGELDMGVWLGAPRTFFDTRWRGQRRVPLSLRPGAAPAAFLDTRPESERTSENEDTESESGELQPESVSILASAGSQRRIAYWVQSAVVIGWVASDALEPALEPGSPWPTSSSFGDPNAPIEPFGSDDPTRARAPDERESSCAWSSPLALETAGVWRSVGTLTSGIPLSVGARRDGLREVRLAHPALSFDADARLWVPESSLYPCVVRR